jgi:hypothetical protein
LSHSNLRKPTPVERFGEIKATTVINPRPTFIRRWR